jgi:DNA mismatch repair protein MutL
LYDILIAVYGLEVAAQMWEISDFGTGKRGENAPPDPASASPTSHLTVCGYISQPALHRANRDYISLFVNGRWIQDRSLLHAVSQAYHTLLPVGRHPVAVVLLRIAAGDVDVNVHPTKREVKFRSGNRVFSTVQRAVRGTLVENASVSLTTHSGRTWLMPSWDSTRLPGVGSAGDAAPQLEMELSKSAAQASEPIGPVRLPLLRVVGQVGQTYIVAEGPQGMYLIDQHAAHERILYEQLQVQRVRSEEDTRATISQTMLEASTLELDPLLAGLLAENLPLLNSVGFDVTPFGNTSYLVRAVPTVLAVPDVATAITEILEALRQDNDLLTMQAEERLIAAICKRAAVKAGQTLSMDEMQRLIRQLEQSKSPRTCPHGRPTIVHFSVEELEKQFGRR